MWPWVFSQSLFLKTYRGSTSVDLPDLLEKSVQLEFPEKFHEEIWGVKVMLQDGKQLLRASVNSPVEGKVASLKLTASLPLKMDGWNTMEHSFSFEMAYFESFCC